MKTQDNKTQDAREETEALVSCPNCHIPNFTPRGLKAHRCKGPKQTPSEKSDKSSSSSPSPDEKIPQAGKLSGEGTSPSGELSPLLNIDIPEASAEVTAEDPKDPAWDGVREVSAQLRAMGRLFLRGQVRLGMLLAGLKRETGRPEGRPKKNSPESGKLFSWAETVKRETGYSRQSTDEFIRLYEAAKLKLKRSRKLDLPAPAKKDAMVLFCGDNALALTDAQWAEVDAVIGSLTTGETQASLMTELGIVAKPKAMPKGGGTAKDEDLTAGQLAFHFFEAMAAPMMNARAAADYKKLLHALPAYSTEENPISLDLLATECRAMLADIAEAQQAHVKPARGRLVG
jgi:hypothetical protein